MLLVRTLRRIHFAYSLIQDHSVCPCILFLPCRSFCGHMKRPSLRPTAYPRRVSQISPTKPSQLRVCHRYILARGCYFGCTTSALLLVVSLSNAE